MNARCRPRMSEVVDILGNIITEAEAEGVNEEVESGKAESNNQKWGFDLKEIVSFRNKSMGKLDWRNWRAG